MINVETFFRSHLICDYVILGSSTRVAQVVSKFELNSFRGHCNVRDSSLWKSTCGRSNLSTRRISLTFKECGKTLEAPKIKRCLVDY